ncbi:MAG: hypothetical protein AAGH78_03995 [Cyanobacteria bacterium P01_H01_bin.58]
MHYVLYSHSGLFLGQKSHTQYRAQSEYCRAVLLSGIRQSAIAIGSSILRSSICTGRVIMSAIVNMPESPDSY